MMAVRPPAARTAAARTGSSRFFCAVIAAIALFSAFSSAAAPVAPPESLQRVRALTRGGAIQLAVRLLDQEQSSVSGEAWLAWEKERFALLRAQGNWAGLADRALQFPLGTPPEFVLMAKTEAAQARLALQDSDGARGILRGLLWSGAGSGEQQAEWRQLVIRSYLQEDAMDDALAALARYREDFDVRKPAWRLLEATVQIRAGKPKEAYALVGDIKTHEGRRIALIAGLRSGVATPAVTLARALALAEETRNKPALNQQVWALAAEAALRANDSSRRMYALERALTLARLYPDTDHLVVLNGDNLWQAYERYAEATGNAARLLVGNDASWLKKAASYKRDDAMQARSFYVFLSRHGASEETMAQATRKLADSLVEDGRVEVLRALYTSKERYPDLALVPAYVRYRLAEQALAVYDIAFAATVMRGLDKAPNGEDDDNWALRRARILIYAGRYDEAQEIFTALLPETRKVGDVLAERVLQVIFDLQAAGRHLQAIAQLERLFLLSENPRTRREILYWIAESKSALGEHQAAAELYLRSANYQHPTGGDMWGQTARYHAAEALGKAGLTQDARSVYQNLLRFTEDARQRAVIERNIQQLWLTEKKTTTR